MKRVGQVDLSEDTSPVLCHITSTSTYCSHVMMHYSGLQSSSLIPVTSRSDPVSRKSIKSAHSSRNRYSSQWTLSRPSQSQSTASARTLTSDWRTMGSHGITATESDSYSASLSQDTGGVTSASMTPQLSMLIVILSHLQIFFHPKRNFRF